jgi:hypothetical protein
VRGAAWSGRGVRRSPRGLTLSSHHDVDHLTNGLTSHKQLYLIHFCQRPLLKDSGTEMAHTAVPLDIWGRVFEHLFSETERVYMSSEASGVMQVCTAWKVCIPSSRLLSFWTDLPV